MGNRSDSILRHTRNALVVIVTIVVLYVLHKASGIIIPFAISVFIFIFVNPLLNKMDRLKIPKILSMLFVLILVCAVLIVLFCVFIGIVNLLLQPDTGVPKYVTRISVLDRSASRIVAHYMDEDPEEFSIISMLNIDWYAVVMGWLSSLSSKMISVMSDAALILLYLLFMIMERQTIMEKLRKALPETQLHRAGPILNRINKQISRYLLLKLIISGATGILFYFTCILVHLDYAPIWGVLATVLNFIPTIGSIVVTVCGIFMALIQFAPDWQPIILASVLFIMIEMVMGNILDPRVQGVRLNISPLVVLIFLAIWGFIWGIPGMFLAVPLTSVIQIVCAEIPALRPIAIMLSGGSILPFREAVTDSETADEEEDED